ncbi:hypothetical protein [Glycomyces terrestris]|uniref:Uncharacterized protein n=1 Tax=Glycomyces terrestris TaxID=2493553 RepID=A0A426UYQ4_9ACTN|nr:hypothetical protein [Glycomyces terrestris]RRR99699.1 hypothetical protein EIW28_13545 [Glycomyces terrestris]
MNDELPDRLRVTAEEFEPDADRMWTRIADGMREPRGAAAPAARRRLMPHLALATGAAVLLVGAVVLFGQMLGLGPSADSDSAPPAGGPGTQSQTPAGDGGTTGGESPSGGPSDTGTTAAETGTDEETPEGGPEAPEWLDAAGVIDPNNTEYWTQSSVVFSSDRALTGLEVELRLAEGEGLTHLDSWTTDDNLFTEAVVTSEDGVTILRWTLKEGAVVPAGAEYTLAGQFDPNGGPRSGEDDAFTITATAEDGATGVLEGGY